MDTELDGAAKESIPEYKKLTVPEREAVRQTMRDARLSGMSAEDQILLGRIAAKSGMNIVAVSGFSIDKTKDGRASLSNTKIQNLKKSLQLLGEKKIRLKAGEKVLTIRTDEFTANKNIFSDKGRKKSEVNARIKAIPDFEKILINSSYAGSDPQIHGIEKEAKKGVVAIHKFVGNYRGYTTEALVREKGARQFLYEIKFIEKQKSSQQSMTDKTASPAPNGDVENNNSLTQKVEKSNTFDEKNIEISPEVLEVLTQNQAIALLQRGVTGDDLLNARDLAEEILSVGGEITDDGKVIVYHGTSKENAEKINNTGKMYGKEDGLFFSTKRDGLVLDYGTVVVKAEIPIEKLVLDDVFNDEVHLRLPAKRGHLTNIRFALDDSKEIAFFDGKNTIYIDATSPDTRTLGQILGHEMWHKMFRTGRAKKLFMKAFKNIDAGKRSEVTRQYIAHYKKLWGIKISDTSSTASGPPSPTGEGVTADAINIANEEVAAAYAEELFGSPDVWDFILSEEPTLKERVLAFFTGAEKRYSFDKRMKHSARRWLARYKKLFSEVSAANKGASAAVNGAPSGTVHVIGKLQNVSENSQNVIKNPKSVTENGVKVKSIGKMIVSEDGEPVTSINREKVRDSGKRSAIATVEREQISIGMSDEERYEVLKDKKITAPVYEGEVDALIAEKKEALESREKDFAKTAIVEIAEKLEMIDKEIDFKDIEVKIMLSKSNLRESITKEATPEQIAKLLPVLAPTAEHSFVIERHKNRYYHDTDTVYFDNLLGAYIDGEELVPVRFGLKHSKTGTTTLYVVVDQNKVALERLGEIRKDRGHKDASPDFTGVNSLRRSVTYSISQIIPFVNSKDLLQYFPDGMLNEKQRIAKQEAVEETIKYTIKKNDRKYERYVAKGDERTAKQVLSAKAKSEGYSRDPNGEIYRDSDGNIKLSGITYDDEGNLIPISKRYDRKNPDIRYALKKTPSATRSEVKESRAVLSEAGIDARVLIDYINGYYGDYGGTDTKTGLQRKILHATELMISKKSGAFDDAYAEIEALADELLSNPRTDESIASELREIRASVRNVKFKVSERDLGDFDIYGGFERFRKSNFGRFKVSTKEGISVDTVYGELQGLFGVGWFPDVNTVSEMLGQISDVTSVEKVEVRAVDYTVEERDAVAREILAKIGYGYRWDFSNSHIA